MWIKYDIDNNGTLEYDELKKFVVDTLKKIKGEDYKCPSEEEMTKTFKSYDLDGNGHVSRDEMRKYIKL